MVNLGIIGCGHWGKNYIRDFGSLLDCKVLECCDINKDLLKEFKLQYPQIKFSLDYKSMLGNRDVQAVVISTPTTTHFQIAWDCLQADKDVLIEKPLAINSKQAKELIKLSEEKNKILMVGHTFLYNTAINRMKRYIEDGAIGTIYYLHATRTHLGLVREDVNSVWDLAPHDVSIFNYLLGATPLKVNALGADFLKKDRHDVAFITLSYPGGVIGNIHVSWADSNKVREVQVVGSKARVVFDDLDNLEKIRLFEKGITTNKPYRDFGEFQYILRDGDIISPRIDLKEPLKEVCKHFLDCIKTRKRPLTDGKNGLEVVEVMEAIDKSLSKGGEPVELKK